MPASKNRHPHKHAPQHHHSHTDTPVHHKQKRSNRPVIVAVIFFAVLGLCIGLFIDAGSITTLLAGAILGAAAGYFAGSLITKSLSGK